MSDNWQKAYSELEQYIAKNPQIKIDMNVIAIPGDVRPEFYQLFDEVREAFLKEKGKGLIDEAVLLNHNYAQAAEEVTKSLGLSGIKMEPSLNQFLHDPADSLMRSLSGQLFDLLKGKINKDTFEHEAAVTMVGSFRQLFQSGYEKWVVLSLVNLLTPDMALAVPTEAVDAQCHELEWDQKVGFNELAVPAPEDTELMLLGRQLNREAAFIFPDLIVRSAKLNCYISITSELTDAMWTAKGVSKKREWQCIRKLGMQYIPTPNWPDIVIHIDNQPEDIGLVADFSRFCRPDIVVECIEQTQGYQKGSLDQIRKNYGFFKPRRGSYIVSRVPLPEEALEELIPPPANSEPAPVQPPDIHIITVGYDQAQLAPIIDALLLNSKS